MGVTVKPDLMDEYDDDLKAELEKKSRGNA